jgi:CDP-glucose 4,6-dehydratase
MCPAGGGHRKLPAMTGFWAGRRVLVTGHTGFKGSWLSLWLSELGADVTGFATAPPTSPAMFELARVDEVVRTVSGDVRDPAEALRAVERARPDVVVHLAAQPVVRRSWREPAHTLAVNVLGTAHVLDAVRAAAPEAAVVVVTSDKCYADPDSGRCFAEDDRLGGEDPYSASKAAAELVAASYRDSFGLRIATARAGNVIGGGDWAEDRIVPDLVRAAAAGTPLHVRDPNAVRPWQHVLNPLGGYLVLAERLAGSEAFATAWNFAPPPNLPQRPVGWVVERLVAAIGRPVAVRSDAPVAPGPHEAARLALNPSRARDRLGWRERWPLERGIEATARWYATVLDGGDARVVTLGQVREFGPPVPGPAPAAAVVRS